MADFEPFRVYFQYGIDLIRTVGIKAKLSPVVIYQAGGIFYSLQMTINQRYRRRYTSADESPHSFLSSEYHPMEYIKPNGFDILSPVECFFRDMLSKDYFLLIATACLRLAIKYVGHELGKRHNAIKVLENSVLLLPYDRQFLSVSIFEERVSEYEKKILTVTGFLRVGRVEDPYKYLVLIVHMFVGHEKQKNDQEFQKVLRHACAFLNDVPRLYTLLRYPPRALAVFALLQSLEKHRDLFPADEETQKGLKEWPGYLGVGKDILDGLEKDYEEEKEKLIPFSDVKALVEGFSSEHRYRTWEEKMNEDKIKELEAMKEEALSPPSLPWAPLPTLPNALTVAAPRPPLASEEPEELEELGGTGSESDLSTTSLHYRDRTKKTERRGRRDERDRRETNSARHRDRENRREERERNRSPRRDRHPYAKHSGSDSHNSKQSYSKSFSKRNRDSNSPQRNSGRDTYRRRDSRRDQDKRQSSKKGRYSLR